MARLIEDVRANLVTRPKTNPFKNKKPTGPQTPVLHVSGITRETQKTLLTGEIELKTGAKVVFGGRPIGLKPVKNDKPRNEDGDESESESESDQDSDSE